ncbi:hypothetical protein WDW37_08405 [Bdellovibrionota bacterium FG-1]
MPKSADIILNPALNAILVVEPFAGSFPALCIKLRENPLNQVIECVSAMDALAIARQLRGCVVVLYARNMADVSQHLTLLKTLGTKIKSKEARLILTLAPEVQKAANRLAGAGMTEVLAESIGFKALLLKVERHILALPQAPKPTSQAAPARPRGDFGDSEAGIRLGPRLNALEPAQDCFALAGGGAVRRSKVWRIRLRGPAPENGRWSQIQQSPDRWAWKTEVNLGQGEWIFSGSKPEYRAGLWNFVSERPALSFMDSDQILAMKLGLTERGCLVVAADGEKTVKVIEELPVLPKDLADNATSLSQVRVVWVAPLDLESDCWAIQKNKPQRISGRWLVRMEGPRPVFGHWVSRDSLGPNESRGAERVWVWQPLPGHEKTFVKESGRWAYFGLRPAFLEGVWCFAGQAPLLVFENQGDTLGTKVELREDGALVLARDSVRAKAAMLKNALRHFGAAAQASVSAPVAPPSAPIDDATNEASSVDAVDAKRPLEPSISPLGLALLVSEVMGRAGMDLGEIAAKYCSFVSEACAGLRAELWFCSQKGAEWRCAGSWDRGPGVLGDLARLESGLGCFKGLPARTIPVKTERADSLGVLVLAGAGADTMNTSYTEAAAQMAVGILAGVAS